MSNATAAVGPAAAAAAAVVIVGAITAAGRRGELARGHDEVEDGDGARLARAVRARLEERMTISRTARHDNECSVASEWQKEGDRSIS